MEDFSEVEQIEAYEAAYPAGGGGGQGGARPSRRARVIDHQLQAQRWLEGLVVQDPRPGDSAAAWLNPSLAARLERAGVPTLFELVKRKKANVSPPLRGILLGRLAAHDLARRFPAH
jgi:hypothetical protein